MAHHPKLHTRAVSVTLPVRYGTLFVSIAIVIWLIIPKYERPYPRESMVLAGSPMTVLSWNEKDRSLILITLPEDMASEGTHGYGTYSFESFWKLGEIDKKDGTVLLESISEALGIPVTWYAGPKTGIFTRYGDDLAIAKKVFSVRNVISYIAGAFRTNIPLIKFISFVWLLQVTKPERIDTYDFTHAPLLIADDVTIADGSHQLLLNPVRVDARLAHVFEDERVRRETLTTAVFNTTDMPSLGNRVGRVLGNVGVSVVSVGNDTPEIDMCTVSGTQESLKSVSAKVIESVLGCTGKQTPEPERADLTVRIGKSFAKRFLPN